MKDVIRETLAFEDLTPEEKEQRGILGRLYGPCADIIGPTRNGRKYGDELWENVFTKNEIVKELLANGGIPGEAQHPTDREEIDTEKIAIMMPEAPKKDKNNRLIGYWDILDTPCGRILYQLAKYGFKLGISSRGVGDIITDENGDDIVDPETYDFTCFDAVIIPAVKEARLNFTEGLNTNKTLKAALTESLNNATDNDRRIMEETIKNLNLDITLQDSVNIENSSTSNNTEETTSDAGVDSIVKNLQEALVNNSKLENEAKQLREKLAVSDTKVNDLTDEMNRYKTMATKLAKATSESLELKNQISALEEKLNQKEKTITALNSRLSTLLESKKTIITASRQLQESVNTKNSEALKLKEELAAVNKKSADEIKALMEKLESAKTKANNDILAEKKNSQKFRKMAEDYKKLAHDVANKYIESKATMLGISANEIKNKLNESYTIEEVNAICEELQNYSLNINKLPFVTSGKNTGAKIRVTEGNKDPFGLNQGIDDEVDADLINLAGLDR